MSEERAYWCPAPPALPCRTPLCSLTREENACTRAVFEHADAIDREQGGPGLRARLDSLTAGLSTSPSEHETPGEPHEFQCEVCGGIFEDDTTEEERLAETKALFGFVPEPEDQASVCDPCHERLMAHVRRTQN